MLSVPAFKPMRRVALAATLCLVGWTATAEEIRLSTAQARHLALDALRTNQPVFAIQLAEGLLKADPRNGEAHLIIARARQQMRQPDRARRPARLAFDLAQSSEGKFRAAQFAARLAVEDKSHVAAQAWLRRSLLYLPDPSYRAQVVADYKRVRRMSPWKLSLQTSLAPTDNLNNGADSPYSLIDGVPAVGFLSGSAQALSGLRATADVGLSYRLDHSKSHLTQATFRYYGQRVDLSDEARALAPDTTNADLAFDYIEIGLTESRSPQQGRQWSYGLSFGQSWSAKQPYQQSLRAVLGHRAKLSEHGAASLTGQIEKLRYDNGLPDVSGFALQGSWSYETQAKARWALSLSLKQAESDNRNSRNQKASANLTWTSGRPIGPVTPTAALGASYQRYPDYAIGFIAVPGGREDRSVFGQLEITMQSLDYGGFVPSLTVQARRTTSNVSRFETRETTVSLGIKSSF